LIENSKESYKPKTNKTSAMLAQERKKKIAQQLGI
jgi:hypothetical protein